MKSLAMTLESRVPNRPRIGCWDWTGDRYANEYGSISRVTKGVRRRYLAHRVAYETWVGPIPDGMVIDHLCRNRACCNPQHLQPVFVAVNQQRGQGWLNGQCKRGHALTPENLYVNAKSGKQQCRGCWKSRRELARAA